MGADFLQGWGDGTRAGGSSWLGLVGLLAIRGIRVAWADRCCCLSLVGRLVSASPGLQHLPLDGSRLRRRRFASPATTSSKAAYADIGISCLDLRQDRAHRCMNGQRANSAPLTNRPLQRGISAPALTRVAVPALRAARLVCQTARNLDPPYCLTGECYRRQPGAIADGAVGVARVLAGRRCARHGHWIGGASPSRGELVATVSRRQLHAAWSVVRRAMLAPRGRVGKKPEANRSTERE